ncbi:MAG: hypothetical protein JJ902_20030 [Roseibium sp.]|nr:hypothetical protein [Roseibium sp.]
MTRRIAVLFPSLRTGEAEPSADPELVPGSIGYPDIISRGSAAILLWL